ncbi:hypothetical protein [Thioalkalivibrio sp. ALR17-21]|uniref:hypothetical protein n=1 Tax=Thioalkalivibrio sp. ALR17-21 TaxID=1269813 RepID=UPI001E531E97|nr:hypothetical protein [Thioalkalivibrio sp. ALR17-21]
MAARYAMTLMVALAGATMLSACAGGGQAGVGTHESKAGESEPSVRYVPIGRDEGGCMQYRPEPLKEDVAVPAAIFFWDGEGYTTNRDRCVPEEPKP